MSERCQLCGSPVELVGSDEGTHYYRPLGMPSRDELTRRVETALDIWRQWPDTGRVYCKGVVRLFWGCQQTGGGHRAHCEAGALIKRIVDAVPGEGG